MYYNPVVKQKWNDDSSIKFRVRDTAGGNLLDVPYDVSARTASLDVVKMAATTLNGGILKSPEKKSPDKVSEV